MLTVSLFGWAACGLMVYVALASSVRKWQGEDGEISEQDQSWVPEIREAGKWAVCAASIFGGAWGAVVLSGTTKTAPTSSGSFVYGAPNAPNASVTVSDTSTWIISGGSFVGSGDATHDSTNIQVDRSGGNFSSPLTEVTIGAQTTDTLSDNTDWKADSTYIVRMRYKANPNKGGWSAYDSVTVLNNGLYPNAPASVDDTIFHYTGASVTLAAPWSYPGPPTWATNVTSINDASNPNGSGKVLQMVRQVGQAVPGYATLDTAAGGSNPRDTIYISWRIKYSANSAWGSTGHKMFYWGNARNNRTQGADNPTQFYATRESTGASDLSIQNGTSADIAQAGAGTIPLDTWVHLEIVAIAETSTSANDGKVWYYKDGSLLDNSTGINWGASGSVGFEGFTWWQSDDAAAGTADTVWVRDLIYRASP